MCIKRIATSRLFTEHTGWNRKRSFSVWPASERCPPPFLLVGVLQQTDNRTPAGLPVHLTGHDGSHTELYPHCPQPYFGFFFFPSDMLSTTLIVLQASYSMWSQEGAVPSSPHIANSGTSDALLPWRLPGFNDFPEFILTNSQRMVLAVRYVCIYKYR